MSSELRNFLSIPYDELEEMNLKAKKQRLERQGTESLVLNRDDAFGMVIGFTQRRIPNDPR